MPSPGSPEISFRAREAERAAIRQAAAEQGITVAGLIREALGDYGIPMVDTRSIRPCRREPERENP